MIKDLIFDIGFHSGQDTDFYLKKGFRVIAIDANPKLIEDGREKFFEYIAQNKLTLINTGIGDSASILPFYVNEIRSEWSSFNKQIGTSRGAFSIIDVPVVSLKSIVEKYGCPYYIKIDIEGYDFLAIQSLRTLNEKPRNISIENGQKHMILELFDQGYTKFKFVNQAEIQKQKLPNPANEGCYIPYEFPKGSSGPFGEEISGDWISLEEVIQLSDNYWNNREKASDEALGWYDLHAKL